MFVQFVSYTDNEGLSSYDAWKDLHTNLLAADQYRDPIQRHSSTHIPLIHRSDRLQMPKHIYVILYIGSR